MNPKILAFEDALYHFCKAHAVRVDRWSRNRKAQVWEIGVSKDILIYVKESAGGTGVWWGPSEQVCEQLRNAGKDWFLVLLVRHDEEAYVINSTLAETVIAGPTNHKNQYIVKEPTLPSSTRLNSFSAIFKRLITNP